MKEISEGKWAIVVKLLFTEIEFESELHNE